MNDGRGLREEFVVAWFRQHARSILAHMNADTDLRKRKLFMWLRTVFEVSRLQSIRMNIS